METVYFVTNAFN